MNRYLDVAPEVQEALKAGLTPEEIDYLGKTGAGVTKASRRDLPILVAEGRDGATTVTTTMMIAACLLYTSDAADD